MGLAEVSAKWVADQNIKSPGESDSVQKYASGIIQVEENTTWGIFIGNNCKSAGRLS